ncbi:MAG: hypothetical protein WBA74_11330 [Cyclobacteriaceae bacterium]
MLITYAHLLQLACLIGICLAAFFTYRLFYGRKMSVLVDDELIFQCNVTRKGSYELRLASDRAITVKEAKLIIRRVVHDMALRDEKLVRILFAESLDKLTEDPLVQKLFQEAASGQPPKDNEHSSVHRPSGE